MATAKTSNPVPSNVRAKLAAARLEFSQRKVQKSGKNIHMEFLYFELSDIVPVATEIFAKLGLVTVTNFTNEEATMTVYNADNTEEEGLTFTAPYREIEPIISNSGKQVTNSLQALGSSITYLRRYLYMIVLDIVEQDDVDATIGKPIEVQSEKKAPATPAERKAAKEELVSADNDASESEINELKSLCKELIGKDEDNEEFVQQIALKTEGFTKIKSSACTELCKNLTEMIKSYGD